MSELMKVRTTLQPWREIEVDAHDRDVLAHSGLLLPEAADATAAAPAPVPAAKPAPAQSPAAPAAATAPAKES